MAGRSSYFAEKRGQNNDPNFFNRIPLDEIRKNVKRIMQLSNDKVTKICYNCHRFQTIKLDWRSDSYEENWFCRLFYRRMAFQ